MNKPGKPVFAAFQSLAETIDIKSDSSIEEKVENVAVEIEIPKKEGIINTIADTQKQRKSSSSPRINKPPISDEMQAEIMRIATQIAEKTTLEKLYGKRSNYKGPRITRSYKIDIDIDKWLDSVAQNTSIEKSTIVTRAIREYLENNYAQYKPEENS